MTPLQAAKALYARKALCAGSALALAGGLLLGGAMRPALAPTDRPEGPQMFEDWTGGRATGPFDDDSAANYPSYSAQISDYALGADAKQQVAWAEPPPEAPAPRDPDGDQVSAYVNDDDAQVEPAAYESDASDAVPTADPAGRDGDSPNAPAHGQAAQQQAPSRAPAGLEPDAPPEATGDTARAAG